jgi:Pumilio-family RNA binding repeat
MPLSSGAPSYNRPRRPAPETIAYLRSLPLEAEDDDLTDVPAAAAATADGAAAEAAAERGSTVEHLPTTTAAALQALYEIRHELASLAGDEHAAECIEALCRRTLPRSPIAVRVALESVRTYGLHLATHRYGSHVLQTILQLVATSDPVGGSIDLALHDDAPPVPEPLPPSRTELILGFVDEIEPCVHELALHICGSHVLRTLFGLLGNVETISRTQSSRRGKAKTRKKKKTKTTSTDALQTSMSDRMLFRGHDNTDDLLEALRKLTIALTVTDANEDGPGDLQRMACHSSAGPVVSVLLQVLSYQRDTSKDIVQRQKEWEATNERPDRHLCLPRPEPRYDTGSDAHRLVQRLLCLNTQHAGEVIYGLAGETRGSHSLEICLRLSPDEVFAEILHAAQLTNPQTMQEFVHDDVSNFVVQTVLMCVRTSEQATAVLDALEPAFASGYLLDVNHKRSGIVWRIIELSASDRGQHLQRRVLQLLTTAFAALQNNGERETRTKWNKCVHRFLAIQKPVNDGDRVTVDASAARAVYHLLRFHPENTKDTIKGIFEIPVDELELLIKDGLASRCILDGILDGSGDAFAAAHKRLVTKLEGHWVAIASDRVGHHTVQKLFRKLTSDDRERLLVELINGKNRLNGTSMGRGCLDLVEARVYETKGKDEWCKIVRKKLEKEHFLDDIIGGNDKKRKSSTAEETKGKNNKSKEFATLSVQAIMDVISMPGNKKKRKGVLN